MIRECRSLTSWPAITRRRKTGDSGLLQSFLSATSLLDAQPKRPVTP
jgi:hypothetical protein